MVRGNHLCGVAVKGNEVVVCDYNNRRVQVFGLDGTFVRQWGGEGAGPWAAQPPVRRGGGWG